MSFKIFNTLSRGVEEFKPLEEGAVRMYTCGPTVYNYAHIGNFRAYLFEDLLRRYLKFKGFGVTQVMNLTDVDDKTIRSSQEKKMALNDYTRTFKDAFFQDLKTLNIEPAEHYPAATDHVAEMIAIIEKLFEKGYAYQSDDRSIYFSIAKFKDYGKLAHLDLDGLKSGARVAQDEYEKESAADFALWKAWDEKDGDVAWDSPWGRGRPGWHIECSAMSMKYLGESFDLHTGGVDNIFPHHEDEIAQSEAATGKPFCKYWMHCAHLVVDGKKMSKSLGNFYTLRDVTGRGYNGREIRYELMATHYRQSLNFTFEALDGARAALQRLDEFSARLESVAGQTPASGVLPPWAEIAVQKFTASLDDDLNVSGALAAIFDLVRDGNIATNKQELSSADARQVLNQLDRLDAVFGFIRKPAEAVDPEIENLLELRKKARQEKNWAESDRLRSEMASRGWLVQDSAKGQTVKKAH
ncbi:MAG: cysteine--tRNA ligase [Lentisphaerae bacterium GWF2_57_35]|nr:MAG: cysteine--tRNA ligase [Lentisphaerae bacterium GWF2_57_35]